MSSARSSAVALHVENAKRLLKELERHAEVALHALGHESGDSFVAAVDERDRIISRLDEIVQSLVDERFGDSNDPEIRELFDEMAQASATALESHNELASHARRERDRLAAALNRATKPDSVAHHYAAATTPARSRTFSVTG